MPATLSKLPDVLLNHMMGFLDNTSIKRMLCISSRYVLRAAINHFFSRHAFNPRSRKIRSNLCFDSRVRCWEITDERDKEAIPQFVTMVSFPWDLRDFRRPCKLTGAKIIRGEIMTPRDPEYISTLDVLELVVQERYLAPPNQMLRPNVSVRELCIPNQTVWELTHLTNCRTLTISESMDQIDFSNLPPNLRSLSIGFHRVNRVIGQAVQRLSRVPSIEMFICESPRIDAGFGVVTLIMPETEICYIVSFQETLRILSHYGTEKLTRDM